MQRFLAFVLFLSGLVLASGLAHAADRVALVVGNADYTHLPKLKNPAGDAAAFGEKLAGLGFEVTALTDLDHAAMEAAIAEFGKAAEGAKIALFYYGGHGFQAGGTNLMIPTDANDVAGNAGQIVGLPKVIDATHGAENVVVLLDASRDNPFKDFKLPEDAASSDGRPGLFLMFATSPGAPAVDGEGEHSPFAAALLEHLGTPGEDLMDTSSKIRSSVYAATNGLQIPWANSMVIGKLVLAE